MKVWLVLYDYGPLNPNGLEVIQVCSTEACADELATAYQDSVEEKSSSRYYVEEWPVNAC